MSSTDKHIPVYVRFAIAGAAGVGAVIISHPFDLIKYRMQMTGKGSKKKMKDSTSIHTALKILKNEGVLGFYDGLSASLLRQLTITMVRLGLYNALVDQMTAEDGTPPPVLYQILAGIISGGAGAIVGNPADIALTRMATQGKLPEKEKQKKLGVLQVINKIRKEEGVRSLWVGGRPHVHRCIVLNLTQVVLYKNTKVYLLHTGRFQDNFTLHILCSLWTAIFSSFATAPLDITKTRLQTRSHKGEYTGMRDAALKIIKHEGILSLWKGITPTFLRIFPHNFMMFILLEHFTRLYKRIMLGDTSGTGY